MAKVRISPRKLTSFLKMDPFGERIKIRFAGDNTDRDLISRLDFFRSLYAEVKNGRISMRVGEQTEYSDYNYTKWIGDIKDELRSVVVFIEGYAGCGKSVFVQKILTEVFPDMDYNRNYYNYDIATQFEENKQSRIKDAILECFIDQYITAFNAGKINVVTRMENMLQQEQINLLDTGRDILYEFTATDAYQDSKVILQEGDILNFKKAIHDQLRKLTTEQVIYVDCIFRLAKYIENQSEPETQIICYDNLDAIENNAELCDFDDVLLTVKENMDSYLSETQENYRDKSAPHFIFFATFRKITAVRVGIYGNTERYGDNRRQIENLYYIDGSHLFDYKEMVRNRHHFFNQYIKTHNLEDELKEIVSQMSDVVKLFNTDFVNSRYSSLWNNNYRTCSDIMEYIITNHHEEVKKCITQSNAKCDSYDDRINVATGASAIFLSVICKTQKECDYWGPDHLALNNLRNRIDVDKYGLCAEPSKTATLSRLILTYIMNVNEFEKRSVSFFELIDVFAPVYSNDMIATALGNMLKHDNRGIWRRPIVYSINAIPDGVDIIDAFKRQELRKRFSRDGEQQPVTEVTTCECGDSFVKRVSADFEFYSARLNKTKTLYLVDNVNEVKSIIDDVLDAVKECCNREILLKEYYCKNKHFSGRYVDLLFHPRTSNKKSQLHVERVIFNHIGYLDSFLQYVTNNSTIFSCDDKQEVRTLIIDAIKQYLDLYHSVISAIDGRRDHIYLHLMNKLQLLVDNPEDCSIRVSYD